MSFLVIALIWRIGLFCVSFLTQQISAFTPRFPYSDIYLIPSGLPQWIWAWANFDGVHYLTIAQRGYFANFTQAFFPLYPILLKIFGTILSDKYLIITGILFSFVTFLVSLKLFSHLLKFDYTPAQIKNILLTLLLFPTGFYFAALYSEALFFMYVIAAFLSARKKMWILAGIFGLLASATRITGILLLPALLWEWFIQIKYPDKIILFKKNKIQLRTLLNIVKKFLQAIPFSPIFYIVPLGLILYMIYLQVKFSDWLYFWHAQPAFGASRSSSIILPPQVVWRYFKILRDVGIGTAAFNSALLELTSYFFAVAVLVLGHFKKTRFSYLLFSWLVILLPTLTGTFSSMPRYILLAFPMYIVIGTIKRVFLRSVILLIFFVLLLLLSYTFIQGNWVA